MTGVQRLPPASAVPGGRVYLVGGGPGNPEYLTLRALRILQQADAVLYDHLVAPAIVDMTRPEAERIYVGKEQDRHSLGQREINRVLAHLAKQGKRVVRLKGGDPFIFGRGGEEIEALAVEGISCEVVPGITAASGVAACAGIPLTHRDYAHSCVLVTGHLKDGSLGLNWRMLALPNQTVVIYMGVHGLALLCGQLIAHGRAASTPAAIVESGTTPAQRVIVGTLGALASLAKSAQIRPPSLVIVGEVVTLRCKLAQTLDPVGANPCLAGVP